MNQVDKADLFRLRPNLRVYEDSVVFSAWGLQMRSNLNNPFNATSFKRHLTKINIQRNGYYIHPPHSIDLVWCTANTMSGRDGAADGRSYT